MIDMLGHYSEQEFIQAGEKFCTNTIKVFGFNPVALYLTFKLYESKDPILPYIFRGIQRAAERDGRKDIANYLSNRMKVLAKD